MAATAVRVFGKPITDGTCAQRAAAAKNNQNADGKLDQVLQVLNQQQKVMARGRRLGAPSTTYGLMYNGSGVTITCKNVYDNWNNGNVVGQYPVSIQNGQWAVFEHEGTRHSTDHKGSSIGAVVYNIEDNVADSMIAWNTTCSSLRGSGGLNTAYCEMNSPGYFESSCNWDDINKKLMEAGAETEAKLTGYATKVTIDKGGDAATYKVIFSKLVV